MFTLTSDKLLSMCSLSPPGSYYIKFNPKFLQSSSDSIMTTAQKSGEAHVAAYTACESTPCRRRAYQARQEDALTRTVLGHETWSDLSEPHSVLA